MTAAERKALKAFLGRLGAAKFARELQRVAEEDAKVWTGNPPGLLQDDCRGLSRWLASKPDAPLHAREAAAAFSQR